MNKTSLLLRINNKTPYELSFYEDEFREYAPEYLKNVTPQESEYWLQIIYVPNFGTILRIELDLDNEIHITQQFLDYLDEEKIKYELVGCVDTYSY